MAYHVSNLGAFGDESLADMNGYIPEDGDGPWDFAVDHGGRETHDEDGDLTEYGEWWEEEGFPDWVEKCERATKRSARALNKWQRDNS